MKKISKMKKCIYCEKLTDNEIVDMTLYEIDGVVEHIPVCRICSEVSNRVKKKLKK